MSACEILDSILSQPGVAFSTILDVEDAFQNAAGYRLDRVVLIVLLKSRWKREANA